MLVLLHLSRREQDVDTGRWNDLGLFRSHESNSLKTLRGISPHHMIFRACIRLVRSLISSRVARVNLFMTNSGAIACVGSSIAPIFFARFARRQRCRVATLGFAMKLSPVKEPRLALPSPAWPSPAKPSHAQPYRAAFPATPVKVRRSFAPLVPLPRPALPRLAAPSHALPCRA